LFGFDIHSHRQYCENLQLSSFSHAASAGLNPPLPADGDDHYTPGMIESAPILAYAILILGAYAAGFIDSIAGGGGMITIPLFLLTGFSPHQAIATNKLQASFGSLTATLRYRHGGLVRFREVLPGIAFTLVGAGIGAVAVQLLDASLLNLMIPVILLALFVYMLIKKDLGSLESRERMGRMAFYGVFGLIIGFYDGFFGPGTGSFWTVAFIAIAGMDIKRATGHTKVVNFTSNIVSLAIFLFGGNILVLPGIVMGLAQIAGAWTGSHLVLKKDSSFVRVMFLMVLGASIVYLSYRAYFAA
jgi:uncharacterized membrane protein YfcA